MTAYVFRHALIREAARNSLLRGAPSGAARPDRGPAGPAPARPEEQPEVLAGHLEAAERFGEADRLPARGRAAFAAGLVLPGGRACTSAAAISLAERMPEGPERDGLELSARVLAGVDADRDARLDRSRGRGALPARAGDRRARRRRPAAVPRALRPAVLPDRQRPVRRRRGDGRGNLELATLDGRRRAWSSRPRSSSATS